MSIKSIKIFLLLVFSWTLVALSTFSEANDNNLLTLYDNFTREYLSNHPEECAGLGLTSYKGTLLNLTMLDDASDQALAEEYSRIKKYLKHLELIDIDTLSPNRKVDYQVLKTYFENMIEQEPYRYHQYFINHMFGIHNSYITLMTEYHPLENELNARDYITRLKRFPQKIEQLISTIKIQQEHGITTPRFIIDNTIAAMKKIVEIDPVDNILSMRFRAKVQKINTSDSIRQALNQEVTVTVSKLVYPALHSFIGFLEEIKIDAPDAAGVWQLPEGKKYYQTCLHYHTTLDLKPNQVHHLGLDEVKRIQKEIMKKVKQQGIAVSGSNSFRDVMKMYWNNLGQLQPDLLYYPDTEKGREQTIEGYITVIERIKSKLGSVFSVLPTTPVTVRPVPKYKEQTAGTYYSPAPLDGSREGIFFANMGYRHFKPGMETLTFHETIPGHHLQIALQRESQDIPILRHILWFTSHGEGWALYAEKLAIEQQWYSDINAEISYLQSELFRAVRLVVDTGIHAKRWTRKQAYDYMLEGLGWASYGEIDRYSVWPGQACAYKIGELKILELRKFAEQKLNKKFNLKDFHTAILKHGSVPLEILEENVRKYIDEKKE